MKPKTSTRSRWLYIRNNAIGAMALIIGFGAIIFGLGRWLDLLWVMPVWLVCLLLWQMVQSTHPRRPAIIKRTTPAQFGLEYEEVHFPSRDGLNLFGYFLKGTRPEAIILAHGMGGGGVTLSMHGNALQKAGYNVLMLDLRGHARSEGNTIDGVQEINDILGAVDYLHTRPEIAADKLGALGISLGARVALHAALKTESLRALLLEGLGPNCLEDHGGRPTTLRRKINYPINWLTYKVGDFISGTSPESNTSALRRLHRPVLVISTGRGKEQYFSRLLFEAASEPKELWEIPLARHAAGYFQDSKVYAERMVRFFDANLA
jgi:pimeloyl-ACP methyl ester carboxylesterase